MLDQQGMRWFVAQTQTNAENKAVAHLTRQGFQTYLPRLLKRRRHARRTETVARPLFPRYVFVAVDTETQRWRAIQSTVGISHLVRRGDAPAPIASAVIEAIKRREDGDGYVRLEARPTFAAGDKIQILDGVFASNLGLFAEMLDEDRVAVLLDLMGRKVRLVLDSESVLAA